MAIDTLNLPQDLYVILFYSLVGGVTAALVGVLAMSVGFVLKSTPATIVAGVILSPIFISGTRGLEQGAQMFLGGAFLLCLIVSYLLVRRVNQMEVW